MRIIEQEDGARVLETSKGAILFCRGRAVAAYGNNMCCVLAGQGVIPSISDFADGRPVLFANDATLEEQVSIVLH